MGCLAVQGTSVELDDTVPTLKSWGYGTESNALRAAVLGEAVERYCMLDVDDRRARHASVATLRLEGIAHVAPSRLLSLPPGATRQGVFADVPPDDQAIQWMTGADLSTGAVTLLPSLYCIGFPDQPDSPARREGQWYAATSNGMATAGGPTAACLSGLFELLERDAFMLMWYHRLRFPYLTLEPSSRLAHRIGAALTGCRMEYRLIDLTEVHGVPTVVAVVRGVVAGDAQYGTGAGTSDCLTEAVWRAVKEALSFYAMQRRGLLAGHQPIRPDEVRNFPHHSQHYLDAAYQGELDFLFEDRPSRPVPNGAHTPFDGSPQVVLRRLARQLDRRGIELYAVDLTPWDVAEVGLVTYKVVSPQLIPLDCDHQARHLSHERLLNEPTRRGWRPDQPKLSDLNHAPHPFP